MATRQTNRRTTGKKTTRRKTYKSKSASKGVFLGLGLIALLIGLISLSIISISDIKGSKEQEEKIVTIIPAKKDEEKKKDPAKVVAVPQKEEKKKQQEEKKVAKKEEKQEKQEKKQEVVNDENISDLIRLVLFDHEISRSSVTERQKKNSSGKKVYYFDITCDDNMQQGVSSAISSLLRKKGYSVKSSDNKVTASSKVDEYSIILKSPVKEVVQKQEPEQEKPAPKKEEEKKQQQVVETKKDEPKYPPLPSPAKKQVNFAILLDDGGNSIELAKEFASIKYPLAIAVLPHLEHTKQTAQIAKKAGKTVFLHFPMAPKSYPNTDPGKGAILPNMPQLIIDGIVKENFENIGVAVDGFNNHMGSGITEDAVKMQQILLASKQYTNRFVDSRTTADTKAYAECRKAGYKCGENRLFIDNDNSVEAILEKIYEAAEKARDDGSIIAIGHIRPNTLQALKIALPELEKRNYKLVSVTKLTN